MNFESRNPVFELLEAAAELSIAAGHFQQLRMKLLCCDIAALQWDIKRENTITLNFL